MAYSAVLILWSCSVDTVCLQPADEKEDAGRHGAGFLVFFLSAASFLTYVFVEVRNAM